MPNQSATCETSRGRPVGEEVVLVGLDFGSTTSSAAVAAARLRFSGPGGKSAFGAPKMLYRSEPVFTPFAGDRLDIAALSRRIDGWIEESGIQPSAIFSGGAIVTGLAARQKNAAELSDLVRRKVGDTLVATADDPCLESWLAFMGNCTALCRQHPGTEFVNLDIGGGTTNPAYGIDSEVLATGCLFVGARHFQVAPGTYRLTAITEHGHRVLEWLGMKKDTGDTLSSTEVGAIVGVWLKLLEATVSGDRKVLDSRLAGDLVQVSFEIPAGCGQPAIVFSGGVGELVYRAALGGRMPPTTVYGDLGVDLALGIARSPVLSRSVRTMIPENRGRATVYGLALDSTQLSGSTLFVADPSTLPCRDLPIVARLTLGAGPSQIRSALALACRKKEGACIQVVDPAAETVADDCCPAPSELLSQVREFGRRLEQISAQLPFAPRQPLVLLTPHNYGHALGNYATGWRRSSLNLVVIDEICDRRAHFVNIGQMRHHMVPVAFYGVH